MLLSYFSKIYDTGVLYIYVVYQLRVIIMENDNWHYIDFDHEEFEQPPAKKKAKKQTKRKWREIEDLKEKQRISKVLDNNEHYYSM